MVFIQNQFLFLFQWFMFSTPLSLFVYNTRTILQEEDSKPVMKKFVDFGIGSAE